MNKPQYNIRVSPSFLQSHPVSRIKEIRERYLWNAFREGLEPFQCIETEVVLEGIDLRKAVTNKGKMGIALGARTGAIIAMTSIHSSDKPDDIVYEDLLCEVHDVIEYSNMKIKTVIADPAIVSNEAMGFFLDTSLRLVVPTERPREPFVPIAIYKMYHDWTEHQDSAQVYERGQVVKTILATLEPLYSGKWVNALRAIVDHNRRCLDAYRETARKRTG